LDLSGEPRTGERGDHEERRHGYTPARSGRSIIFGMHFAFANELRHCRGKGAANWRKAQLISMMMKDFAFSKAAALVIPG
jgi:hypothetical protein